MGVALCRLGANPVTFLDSGPQARNADQMPAPIAPAAVPQGCQLTKPAGAAGRLCELTPDKAPNSQPCVPVVGPLRVVTVERRGADAKLARLAAAQLGLASRTQLLAAGLSPRQIQVRLAREQLRIVHRGVYSVSRGSEPPRFRETAALLACGDHAALSHLTAIWLWGLLPICAPAEVDVTTVRRCGRSRRGIRVHHSRTLMHRQVHQLEGLPVTAPARALLDSAPLLTKRQLGQALDEALAKRVTSFTKVADLALIHSGHPGLGRLRAVIEQRRFPTVTESEAEERFMALMQDAGLPTPRTQVSMHGFRVDVYWPEARFAVEIDGFQWHNRTKKSFERDRRKQQVLQEHEIEVARTTWEQITEGGLQLVAHVSRRLALRTMGTSL
jgi:very-short-patch-repair endonuclease